MCYSIWLSQHPLQVYTLVEVQTKVQSDWVTHAELEHSFSRIQGQSPFHSIPLCVTLLKHKEREKRKKKKGEEEQ